ncbi:hypothetical protein LCGC14_0728390 [marine sediment metagenome]|uniref:Uncharacterized protein n=1 Tax=marine sediment metagenome TaxID=412755 RepID=A0A0F9QEK4_9ZZZZ
MKSKLRVVGADKVIRLHDAVANCPECQTQSWYIKIDGFGSNWNNIVGVECEYCGLEVEFVLEGGCLEKIDADSD